MPWPLSVQSLLRLPCASLCGMGLDSAQTVHQYESAWPEHVKPWLNHCAVSLCPLTRDLAPASSLHCSQLQDPPCDDVARRWPRWVMVAADPECLVSVGPPGRHGGRIEGSKDGVYGIYDRQGSQDAEIHGGCLGSQRNASRIPVSRPGSQNGIGGFAERVPIAWQEIAVS